VVKRWGAQSGRIPWAQRPWASERRGRIMVAILAFSGILAALMQSIVIPIVSDLPRLLDTSSSNASWVITATLLAAAITTPISGRLGDMFGKRKVLLTCLGILAVGSFLCASSSYLPIFLIGRAMQGTAMSVVPLGISILRDELRPDRVPSAIALISATLGAGASVALPVSAYIAQTFDWHIMFWAAGGVAVFAMAMVIVFLPESPTRDPGRFDVAGALGLSVGLLLLLLPITKGATWGWGNPVVIGMLMCSVVVLVAWVWFETRQERPMVDIKVSASRAVLLTNIASILAGFAMFSINLVLPQLLQAPTSTGYGLGQSMFLAGLCMAPGGIVMMLLSPAAGKLSTRRGPKFTLLVGLSVIASGYMLAAFFMSHVWQLVVVSAINGAGVGLAFAAMPALIMSAVPSTATAAANGLNTLMRAVGTSSASAVLALVLTSMTQSVAGFDVPTEQAFVVCFALGASAALIGLVVAMFIPVRRYEVDEVRPRVRQLIEEGF
jgi:EmrB/QacA subfamily drug resistance transporter